MELRHLRYFVVLAEELHFGRAAQRLEITQPPLSFNIRQLEEQLDVRLFQRDRKTVTLTSAGRTLLTEARGILERSAYARDIVKAATEGRSTCLRVGFSGSMIYAGVPQLVAAFSRLHPHIDVKLTESGRFRQFEALSDGRIEAAFVDTNNWPSPFDATPLCDEAFVCCLPEGHPLAGQSSIDVQDLASDDFIMFTRDSESASYDRVISICVDAGFEPRTKDTARQWLSIIALVAGGLGVAIVPERIARTGVSDVQFIALRTPAAARSHGYLVWDPRKPSEALNAFIELVRQRVGAR